VSPLVHAGPQKSSLARPLAAEIRFGSYLSLIQSRRWLRLANSMAKS